METKSLNQIPFIFGIIIILVTLVYVVHLPSTKDYHEITIISTDYGKMSLWDSSYDEFQEKYEKLDNLDLVVTLSKKGYKWYLTNPKPDIDYNDIVVVGNYLYERGEFTGYAFRLQKK